MGLAAPLLGGRDIRCVRNLLVDGATISDSCVVNKTGCFGYHREAVKTTERTSTPADRKPVSARDPRLRGWRALLTAHALLVRRLEEELREETGMSLPEYSALLQLAEAPERRKRMAELADGMIVTRGGVTRLVERLEADGLVKRGPCASDGRGTEAILTEAGLQRLRAASKTHLRGIDDYYLERVSGEDQQTIERVMEDVVEGLRAAD